MGLLIYHHDSEVPAQLLLLAGLAKKSTSKGRVHCYFLWSHEVFSCGRSKLREIAKVSYRA